MGGEIIFIPYKHPIGLGCSFIHVVSEVGITKKEA
jgi:hypothetical protein